MLYSALFQHLFLFSEHCDPFLIFCIFRKTYSISNRVNQDCKRSCLCVQIIAPVYKAPEFSTVIRDDIIVCQIIESNINLLHRRRIEIRKCFFILCLLVIISESGQKQKRVIKKICIIRFRLRFQKKTRRDLSFVKWHPGKKIKTSFYQVIILKCLIVCSCLKSEISQPEPTVSLRAVFKDVLHTILKSSYRYAIYLPEQRIFCLQRFYLSTVYSRYRSNRHIVDHERKFQGNIDHFDLQIAKCISSGKSKLLWQNINMDILLLKPSLADPSVIFIRIRIQFFPPFCKS